MGTQSTDRSRLAGMPLLDEAAIEGLRDTELGGDPEFLAELVVAFLGDSPPRIETLREGLASGDAAAIVQAAHSLKGSSGNFGAMRMQTLCADIERLSRDGHLAPLAPLVERLGVEYALVADRLAELVADTNRRPAAGSRQLRFSARRPPTTRYR